MRVSLFQICVIACLRVGSFAKAAPIDTTNAWGLSGVYRLGAAQTARTGALTLAVSSDLGVATGFFLPGDRNTFNRNRLTVAWAPAKRWELALGAGLVTNRWQTFLQSDSTVLGNPALRAKFVLPWAPISMRLALRLGILLPSALESANIVERAANIDIEALATKELTRWAALSATLGYLFDGSHRLSGADLQPDVRLAYDVWHGSAVLAGVGFQTAFAPHPDVGLGPFAEASARLDTSGALSDDPVLLNVGLKAWSRPRHVFEAALGCELRALGAPSAAAATPGAMPWMAFAMFSLHFLADDAANRPCDTDAHCPHGMQCAARRCVVVKEATTFVVEGSLVDDKTKRGIEDAKTTFGGFEKSPITPDRTTGGFTSFPLPCGETPLTVRAEAPGYKARQAAATRGAPGQSFSMVFELEADAVSDQGTVRGTIVDALRGTSMKATLAAPASGWVIEVQSDGSFSKMLPPGHYELLFSAPGFITQKERVRVHAQETIILNVELQHRPARRER